MTDVPNQELHRVVTTAIIFRDDNRVLITKRAEHKKVWPGKWTVPGGGLETDDYTKEEPTHTGHADQWYNSVEAAVRREVLEETGLFVSDLWLVCDLTFIRPDGVPTLVLSYAGDLASEDRVILDGDAVEYAWVTLQEAQGYDLIDGIYSELEIAFNRRWMSTGKNATETKRGHL